MTRILLIGGGNMGGALLAGWREAGIAPSQMLVVEPREEAAHALRQKHIPVVARAKDIPSDFSADVILLAVKPQMLAEILPEYSGHSALYISIAAGRTLSWFSDRLDKRAAIVRAMPNTPAMVRAGMTALVANAHVSADQKILADDLLSAVGKTLWLSDESLLDAVTAISGSGPAYVLYFMESWIQAATSLGLSGADARLLVEQTVMGTGALALQSSTPLSELRHQVTSPGGTTQAALDVLMRGDLLEQLLTQTVKAALERSRALAAQ